MFDWFFHESVRLCGVEAKVEREPSPVPQFICNSLFNLAVCLRFMDSAEKQQQQFILTLKTTNVYVFLTSNILVDENKDCNLAVVKKQCNVVEVVGGDWAYETWFTSCLLLQSYSSFNNEGDYSPLTMTITFI